MAFQSTPMKVSKTVKVNGKNERQEVGTVSIHIPLMDEILKFAATAKQAEGTDDKGKPTGKPAVDDDGLPVYETEEANWILGAVAAAAAAAAGAVPRRTGQRRCSGATLISLVRVSSRIDASRSVVAPPLPTL